MLLEGKCESEAVKVFRLPRDNVARLDEPADPITSSIPVSSRVSKRSTRLASSSPYILSILILYIYFCDAPSRNLIHSPLLLFANIMSYSVMVTFGPSSYTRKGTDDWEQYFKSE